MLLTGLSVSAGQASAAFDNPLEFGIQNKATGLCLQAVSSTDRADLSVGPCDSSPDQKFVITDHNKYIDTAANKSCLAADPYGDAVSVDCNSSDYNTHWARLSDVGDWTIIRNANGCYLKLLDNKLPACVQGAPTDNGQWRTVRRHSDHHQGTEAGNGRVKWADFWGRGKGDDYITIGSTGAVTVWPNNGGDGHGGWGSPVQVATGITADPNRVRFADFDGDGLPDYIAVNPDGSVHVYLNRGGDTGGGWQDLGIVATGLTTDLSRVRFADMDGDGRADYNVINPDGSVTTYLNRGGDNGGGWQNLGRTATGLTTDQSRVRFADLDGDGKADYVAINPNGSVTAYRNNDIYHDQWASMGQIASGITTNQNAVVLGDFTGDNRADYITTDPSGKVNVYRYDGGSNWTNLGQVATGA
ncbi:FG-GAP-like repeat-containing protein [Kitasatospora sp. NPDC089509]|uniref:FG-GAP-like repeat-containing protein n=1 Tax=Kitasatospora sp. NPDC089509 TaxID=3364079 RepID=UPI0037F7F8C8